MVERGLRPEFIPDQNSILTRDVVEGIMEYARENLLNDCFYPTLFFRFENGERGIITLPLPGGVQDRMVYFKLLGLSMLNSGNKISEAILVSDSWIVLQSDAGELEVAPSKHPNRKEALTLIGRNRLNNRRIFAIQPYHRDIDNQPVFELLEFEVAEELTESEKWTSGLLDYLFIQEMD